MCKKMFTLTIAALAVLATANLAQAQIVKKFSSNSQTVINQNAGSSTIISPSGIVQQSGFQNTAVDSRSNFAGFTTSPGGVTFGAGAAMSSSRDNSQNSSISGPGFSVAQGSRQTSSIGASTVVGGSITPSGAVVSIGTNTFANASNSNFKAVNTPFGSTFESNKASSSVSSSKVKVIRN